MLAGIGISSFPTLFVLESSDDRFAGIELPKWRWNDQWGTDHCWALLGIAPALTLLGIRVIQRCFSFDRSRINLACRTYAYLDRWDDWAPYPKLFSQRRAVQLLYHMKLIRVSHRFGKLEIRIRRNVSQKRSVIS